MENSITKIADLPSDGGASQQQGVKPPETISISNLKNNYVMMWDGINWNLHNRDNVLEDMYENKSNILTTL